MFLQTSCSSDPLTGLPGNANAGPVRPRRPALQIVASLVAIALPAMACTGDDQARPSPALDGATPTPEVTFPAPSPEPRPYVAVALERAGGLAVLAGEPLEVVTTVDVPPGPHNLAAHGPVVLATHPGGRRVSRLDVASGETTSADVGSEPHDVKITADGAAAHITDEAGRRLLTLDPDTLEVADELPMPGEPHDLIVRDDGLWVTLLERDELAHVRGEEIRLVPTGRSPHDLVSDPSGRIWFSNWDSDELAVLDPATGDVRPAPAGVVEPHHFAVGPDGTVWVSDNGGAQVVAFPPDGERARIPVGPVPHHLDVVGEHLVVAVSGAGEAAVVEGFEVVRRVPLSRGLHGVAAGHSRAIAGAP